MKKLAFCAGIIAASYLAGAVFKDISGRNIEDNHFLGAMEVPAKIDFWDLAKQWYESRGMEADEFEKIKEAKKRYRESRNNDWPDLSDENEVDVTADENVWKENGVPGAAGHYNNSDNRIEINPVLKYYGKDELERILMHEAMHSAQDLSDVSPNAADVKYTEREYIRQQAFSSSCSEEEFECYCGLLNRIEKAAQNHEKFQDFATEADNLFFVVIFNKRYLNESFLRLKGEEENEELEEDFSELNRLISKRHDNFHKHMAGVYTGSITELDPRLSEIARFWYEKEGETISDENTAISALNQFMNGNVPRKYITTQIEIRGVRDHYTERRKWTEVKKEMIERLVGLL